MTLVEEITQLEASLPSVKETRKANGIPALDGCPTPWLERYVAELRRFAAPQPVVVVEETDLQRRSRELDEWWREQSARKPNRFQVWRLLGRRCVRMLASTNDQAEACRIARTDAPAMVLDSETLVRGLPGAVLRVTGTKVKTERGPLAAPTPPPEGFVELLERVMALAAAPDGTPVRDLRLPKGRERALADMVCEGVFRWKGRRKQIEKVEIRLELEKGRRPTCRPAR